MATQCDNPYQCLDLDSAQPPETEPEQETETEPAPLVPRSKVLPRARKRLLDEFKINDDVLNKIANMLEQEPYNMIKNRTGERVPSSRWSTSVEKLWAWNNAKPDPKGRQDFVVTFTLEGHTFNRRDLMAEPILRADLTVSLQRQIRALGYSRVYVNAITRRDWDRKTEFETLLIKVPV